MFFFCFFFFFYFIIQVVTLEALLGLDNIAWRGMAWHDVA